MNRIYQGRVSSVQIPNPDKTARKAIPWLPLDPDAKRAGELGEAALWEHHQLFQDAVNYYVLALASLGISPESKLTKLRELLAKVWETADKRGQRRSGMGVSLQRTWQLKDIPTLSQAIEWFQAPLFSHGVEKLEMELAGESLLEDLGGEGSIKQNGQEYWPYFCQSGFKRGVTFPRSADQLSKEKASVQIPRILWHPRAEANVHRIYRALKQAHFCNLAAGADPLPDERNRMLFSEALKTLFEVGHINEFQKNEWTAIIEKKVPAVLSYAGGSINKDALKERFYGFLIFHYLSPTATGLAVLKRIFKKPETRQQLRRGKAPADREILETRLRSLGDDPIKLVRNRAHLVFRAFTALPIWKSTGSTAEFHERSAFGSELKLGDLYTVGWKEFDIAAFKEALKVYNQFQQNVDRRDAKLDDLATRLLVMDGRRAFEAYSSESELDQRLRSRLARIWAETEGKPKLQSNELGEDATLERFAGDPRIERLRQIVNADLAEEYRLTDGRMTPYGLRRRTMKGWSEVKRRWQKHAQAGTPFSEEKRVKLRTELDELRGGEKREQIGSHRLFEALLQDEAAWKIWREPDEKQMEAIA
ncbi:MAG TPA: hypothetical protein PLV87_02445, partial [Opitutaceae bacterium]|nr:hypothetical protein [Opitutaceae bacterium]